MRFRSLYRNLSLRANQLFVACLCLLRGALSYLTLRSLKRKENNEMPQEMNVLSCYNCSMYQVHIVKKSNKWQCKICGEKQSIQVVYFQGSGSDCRKQVQHLNGLKAEQEDQESFHSTTIEEYGLDCVADKSDEIDPCNCSSRANKRSAGKWAKYLESDEDDSLGGSSDEKENLSSSQKNMQKLRKQFYSLPTTQNSSETQRESSDGTENLFSSRKNTQKRRKKFYSLPPTQNSSETQRESAERFYEYKAGSSKSRTYPLTNNSPKVRSKWDKFLEDGDEGRLKSSDNEIPPEDSAPSSSPSKKQIFDDSNDDLDVVIDF